MSIRLTAVSSVSLAQMEVPEEVSRQLRRADDFIRLGVVAAHGAMTTVKEADSLCLDTIGLFLGTAFGPMETNFEVLDQVVTSQPVSPVLFSHSVFNAAAGYLASVFGIKGCAMTFTDFGFPFFRALEQGYLAVASGRLSACLVLQVETYSALLHDARQTHVPGVDRWRPGAVCWLLEQGEDDDSYCLAAPTIKSQKNCSGARLSVEELIDVGSGTVRHCDPLGSADFLTGKIAEGTGPVIDCSVRSGYGTVELHLKR